MMRGQICRSNMNSSNNPDNKTTPLQGCSQSEVFNRTQLLEENDAMFLCLLPVVIYLCVLMTMGTVGNLLVIYIFGWKLKSSSQNFLFICMAVFDLLTCTVGMPSEIVDLHKYYLYENAVACKVMRFLLTLTPVTSVNLLLFIAIDRYRRVCKPLHAQLEVTHAKKCLAVSTAVAVLFACPALSVYGKRTVHTKVDRLVGCDCSVQDKYQGRLYPLLYEIIFGVTFIIYSIGLSFMYLRIWLVTRRHRIYLSQHSSVAFSSLLKSESDNSNAPFPGTNRASQGRASSDINVQIRKSLRASKLTVISLTVTLVFIVSYLPHFCLVILRTIVLEYDHHLTGVGLVMYNIFIRSYFLNSVANIFVYGAINTEFKQEVRVVFSKLCALLHVCKRRGK